MALLEEITTIRKRHPLFAARSAVILAVDLVIIFYHVTSNLINCVDIDIMLSVTNSAATRSNKLGRCFTVDLDVISYTQHEPLCC